VTDETDVGQFFVVILRSRRAAYRCAHQFAIRAAFRDGAHVVHVKALELQRFYDHIEVGDDEGRLSDLENISAEPRDFLFDIHVCPLHQGHHSDQRGDAHGESDGGEDGAQLVLAQRVEALAQVVGQGQHLTALCASISCRPASQPAARWYTTEL
jgi:hypothetical protein